MKIHLVFNAWISWFSGNHSRCWLLYSPISAGSTPAAHLFRYSPDDLAEPRPGVIFVGGPNPFKRVESFCKLVLEFSTSTEFFGVGMCLIDVATCCEMKNIIANVPICHIDSCVSNGAKSLVHQP